MFNPYKRSDDKHVFASNTPPVFFELEVCYFPRELKTTELSVDVTAMPDEDEDGYGSAQVLAAHTDQNYWYEVMLTHNWYSIWKEDEKGRKYYYHYRGYSVQFHIWDPNGEIHWNNETHLLGGERVDIQDGERVNLAMQLKGDEVILGVYGRKSYQVKYPSYGARHFVGTNLKRVDNGIQLHEKGYFTGIALERYHTKYMWGGKRDHTHTFTIVVPNKVQYGSFEIHARDDATKERMYDMADTDIQFEPHFNHDMKIVDFTGNPQEINILVRGEAFRRQSAGLQR